MYNAFVRSVLEFASVSWNPAYAKHSQGLESIQRAFTRHLAFRSAGISHRRSYEQRLDHFKMSSLHSRRLNQDITFLHKIVNSTIEILTQILDRIYLKVLYSYPRFPIAGLFWTPRCRTNLGRNSLISRICSSYSYVQGKNHDIDIFGDNLTSFKRKIEQGV